MNLNKYLSQEKLTQAWLAEMLGVSQGAVGQWSLPGRRIPAEHCSSIERLTKGQVTCEEMRPDVYLRAVVKKSK